MKYKFNNAMSKTKYIKCIRPSREWVNQDLPDIMRMDGSRAIEVTFPEYKVLIYADNQNEANKLEHFVKSSTGKEPEIYIF
ncbi:MAG: hypothetical protein IPM48_15090 [Saprospiraceae bacterium]|nr:hypothetical protein [Saprospiraceae bacterium]MBK9272908.1 hypothetical protein [Saprospiraceae bacterium]